MPDRQLRKNARSHYTIPSVVLFHSPPTPSSVAETRCAGWLSTATVAILLAALLLPSCASTRRQTLVIGCKNFTEQVVLGELLAQHLQAKTGLHVERRFYLAGTYIAHQALLAGRIDCYVEYTGTALTAILKQPIEKDSSKVYDEVKREYASRFKVEVMDPLGFNNTFAMVIRGEDARRLNLHTMSQAVPSAAHWRPGFGYEFMERADGYEGFRQAYHVRFGGPPRIMDLGLLYRALLEKQVDLVAGNSTDGLIAAHDLAILADDKHYFPPYQAVPLVRDETLNRHPDVRDALNQLGGKISDEEMRKLNYAVDGEHRDVGDIVHEFLRVKKLD
jgi:osmoprotectant transport system substrate-binding protein